MESKEKILEQMNVDPNIGLNKNQILESIDENGLNSFTGEKQISLIKRILKAVSEPMLIMLLLAGVIATGVNIVLYLKGKNANFLECVGIFIAIGLSVMITVIMEGRSAKAFETLTKINEDAQIRAIRDGNTLLISQKDVVVGDIIILGIGDKIPADGRIIESISLQVDESSLTGESIPVSKDSDIVFDNEKTPIAERVNMVYSGCFVINGSGKAIITGVGDNTEFGKIAKELSSSDSTSTPLQEKLAKLGKTITILGSAMAAIVFIIQVMIFVANGTATFENISDSFITSIILIVAAVPEGLPTIVAVSLAINIIKMSKQNALVKKMIACETIGCINVICSDKTGTLTENRMTVIDIYTNEGEVKPENLKNEMLIKNFCVNNTSDVSFEEETPSFIGNPTECALIVASKKAKEDYKKIRDETRIVHVFPFSSDSKSMTTIIEENNSYMAFTKGSPEKILSICDMSKERKKQIEERITEFQKQANRIIGFSHREIKDNIDFQGEIIKIEEKMIFDGFVIITDPLRNDVYEAVEKCDEANIKIKMLTGDNIITAKAIATQLKILDSKHIAIEASELDYMSDEKLKKMLPNISVIARSTPGTKMRVVNVLKEMGNVVAVTGDGINDAPAIKNADVGIAMGISGTEVSKEASDIVLLDDSFSTIVRAVKWGRGIYENFQRFIQFQLTVNLSSVIVVLTSIIVGIGAPFTALQLLWINIIMDGPPALTLGLEPIHEDLMKREPTKRNSNIVSKNMLTQIIINGVYISIIFMLQNEYNFLGGTSSEKSTILFTLFVVFQLFNAFNSRELGSRSIFKNLVNNRLMLIVFGITFALQILITEFGGSLFETTPIHIGMWIKIIALGFTVILVSELFKLIRKIVL